MRCLIVRSIIIGVAGLAMVFGRGPVVSAGVISIIDQQNPGPFTTTNGTIDPFFFGQTFTPTLPGIDAIEFLLGGGNATVIVDILNSVAGPDGLGGSVIASSLPVSYNLPGGHHIIHFDFLTTVNLTPGQTYVARIHNTAGPLSVRHTQGNAYAGGQFLHQGFSPTSFVNADLVFTEGLHAAVPEPSTLVLWSLGAVALVGLGWRRRKRAA